MRATRAASCRTGPSLKGVWTLLGLPAVRTITGEATPYGEQAHAIAAAAAERDSPSDS